MSTPPLDIGVVEGGTTVEVPEGSFEEKGRAGWRRMLLGKHGVPSLAASALKCAKEKQFAPNLPRARGCVSQLTPVLAPVLEA